MQTTKTAHVVECDICKNSFTFKARGFYGLRKALKVKKFVRVKKDGKWITICRECNKKS